MEKFKFQKLSFLNFLGLKGLIVLSINILYLMFHLYISLQNT